MPDHPTDLPIEQALPALRRALAGHPAAVLQAPPGAGKTTRVPLALLDEPWLAGQRIVMLEPRRLAARAAAHRMAVLLGERVGETAGYRVRLDTRVGPTTRIEVVTEGVLTRLIQADPALDGIGLVIFDEFHERSLVGDLGLALALETQAILRPDLRLLVMSATLDGAAVATLLGDAPVVTSKGRMHPVAVRYLGRRAGEWIEPAVAAAVREALAREAGDLLVFLPGAGEIRRTAALLAEAGLGSAVDVLPLHGTLAEGEQDRAIRPSPPGRRKVVLASAIAETSLTIDGIGVVVDGGLARVPRFSPRTGMTRLETVRVSRASAEQRCGRAGRLGPGVCYRLWSELEQAQLVPAAAPEILEADLAPLALDLANAGVGDPAALRWLDPPPPAAFRQARTLLAELGALGADGRITAHGRRMARLALHPRLAHMILATEPLGLASLACDVAALVAERDILRGEGGPPEADLRLRLEALRGSSSIRRQNSRGTGTPASWDRRPCLSGPEIGMDRQGRLSHDDSGPVPHVDRGVLHRVRAEADQLRRQVGAGRGAGRGVGRGVAGDVESCGLVLAFAYPDRIAQRRPGGGDRYLLRNGRGAYLAVPQGLSGADYLVVAETDGQPPESRIFRAVPIAAEDIEAQLGERIVRETEVTWDREAGAVRARTLTRLGALVLAESAVRDPDPALVAAALAEALAREGLDLLPWSAATRQLQQRLVFLHTIDPASWPDFSDAALRTTIAEWLGSHLHGLRRLDDVRRLDLAALLLGRLPWQQRAALDERAPSHVTVPSGSRIAVDYGDPAAPALAVRLQEVFGWMETPRIAGGTVPLTLHLLSPAHRPVQVTRDLAGFWRSTYFEVKKDLKGRYPKHYWPDDPLQATATRRARPRG